MATIINELKRYIWAEATNIRDFDRTFILFGKGCSGKSTLGNFLLWKKEFEEHSSPEAFGLTKAVHSRDTFVDPRIVYGEECSLKEPLKIQILDQPGCNDNDFLQEDYCQLLLKCIAESKGEMCANFLILINLKSDYLSPEECLTIMNIAEILSKASYSFFPNAAIVFTHADKIDVNLNEEILERELRKMIKKEEFSYIEHLVNLVERRYMFINGANKTQENRNYILKKLFQLTKPILTVYINGNHGFKGDQLKSLLGVEPKANTHQIKLLKYDVNYYFNPDLNLFRKDDTLNLGQEITQALNRLSAIGKGVSVLILLVNLEEIFNQEIYNLILKLPDTYRLGQKFKEDFWSYACILFKGPSDDANFLKRNFRENPLLSELVNKVNSRYDLVSNRNSREECSHKILDLVKRVKLDTKTYLDSTVLKEMRGMIEESIQQRKLIDGSQITGGITSSGLFRVETTSGPKIIVTANNFFWSRESISPQIGYIILNNINPIRATEFKEKYKDRTQVTTQEFAQFVRKR